MITIGPVAQIGFDFILAVGAGLALPNVAIQLGAASRAPTF
jgi:hypothetical protein